MDSSGDVILLWRSGRGGTPPRSPASGRSPSLTIGRASVITLIDEPGHSAARFNDCSQMIYTFDHAYYLLLVKKVKLIETPGCRKIARVVKVVFEAYRRDDEGKLVRCDEERIAMHVYMVCAKEGCWHTITDDDKLFLGVLGLPPTLDLSLDLEKRLNGWWIEGLPGPPGPDGFNPLEEFKAIQSPVPTVFHPAPPASGIASTSAVSQVDTSASADYPSRQDTAGTRKDFSPVHESISSEASDCSELLSELGQLPDRIVERIQPLIASGLSDCVGAMTDRPSRAAETAYRAYQLAEETIGNRIGDKDAYEWLRENGPDEYTLPPYENWARYLRQARQHYGDQKHRPRKGRTGRSIVHLSEI